MSKLIMIAVDAMGGDHAPGEIVKGSVEALSQPGIGILLVGDETAIQKELSQYTYDQERIRIVHAPEVIATGETPTTAIRQKKGSSLVVGMNLVKQGEADAIVSAGNTGALLAGSTMIIGRIKGIERPALATLLANEKGYTFLIDAGANVDAKPSYLVQFAKMGSVYMENVMGVSHPRVGLVNIGAEAEKGNSLVKEAYPLLEQAGLNFTGNAEARDIPSGVVDVAVCDAFVGNVILKYSEGFAKSLLAMIKKELMSSPLSKLGGIMAKSAFTNLKKSFDYSEVGGAPFLGLNALVVKAHGSSDAKAIRNAIKQCKIFHEKDIIAKIQDKL